MSERFVIQLRRGSEWARMFLRWREAERLTGFVETAKGGYFGTVDQPAGPSFSGRPCAYESREDAQATLDRCIKSGQMLELLARCEIRPSSEVR